MGKIITNIIWGENTPIIKTKFATLASLRKNN